eukprot:364201-Chlamydomonas_euryale.AAC.19
MRSIWPGRGAKGGGEEEEVGCLALSCSVAQGGTPTDWAHLDETNKGVNHGGREQRREGRPEGGKGEGRCCCSRCQVHLRETLERIKDRRVQPWTCVEDSTAGSHKSCKTAHMIFQDKSNKQPRLGAAPPHRARRSASAR